MEVSFKDKVVLVTGASAGIGKAIAILFAKCGARLALVGRNEVNLEAVAAACEGYSKDVALVIVADLATDEGCEAVAKKTIDRFGKLNVLINNAGVGARETLLTSNMESFDRVFNLNLRGVYNLTRLLVNELITTRGSIVNISSIGSSAVILGNLAYNMAKAALDHYTRLTALELAPKGVRVNSVLPGFTISEFTRRVTNMTDEQYKEWLENVKKVIPMGEVCKGEDIANMVVHLASERSRLVTGALIPVDGGARFAEMCNIMKKCRKEE